MKNKIILDRARMPKKGCDFLIYLHQGLYEPPLKGGVGNCNGYPKFVLTKSTIVPPLYPNLINLWVFEDELTKGQVIGGILGPTKNPSADWKKFEEALEALSTPHLYQKALDLIDDAIGKYVLEYSDLFQLGD